MIHIYPFRKDTKKTFDSRREELNFWQSREPKKQDTIEEATHKTKDRIEQEWCKWYCDLGLTSDYRQRLVKNFIDLEKEIIPGKERSEEGQYRAVRQMEI